SWLPKNPLPADSRRRARYDSRDIRRERDMILYCVRHGETVFNSGGRIQGQLDTPLSELGQRQCLAITATFRGQPIEAVYSSPLQRALGSATRVADALGLQVRTDPRLMEINAGIFQGLTWDEIAIKYPEDA